MTVKYSIALNCGKIVLKRTEYEALPPEGQYPDHEEFVCNTWNSLPESVVSAPSLNTFKNKLHKH